MSEKDPGRISAEDHQRVVNEWNIYESADRQRAWKKAKDRSNELHRARGRQMLASLGITGEP